jgi:uncharacterized protein YndB with AHSA1/START domain
MILRSFLAVAILIAVILIFAAAKPNTFQVRRSIVIHAPREKVFPLINDFHYWSSWAPQDREDSSMTRTFDGSTNGVGAISEWRSTGRAGKGRMTITESVPLTMILVKVDFVKPFEAHNLNEFTLESYGTSTKVTWTLQGTNLYIMKLMGMFVNMDRMMGKHFETGLSELKILAEQ